MILYLMRHGIAVDPEDTPGLADDQRPLTPEGIAKAQAVAKALGRVEPLPTVVLSSSLVRAAQTADLVTAELALRRRKTVAALTPGSPVEALVDEVAKTKAEAVLCVGHAPHLDLVIGHLVAGLDRPLCELKKAGVACLDLELSTRRALLVWLLQPGLMKRLK